jgi:hypothetical protein
LSFSGHRVTITTGATRAPIDSVVIKADRFA